MAHERDEARTVAVGQEGAAGEDHDEQRGGEKDRAPLARNFDGRIGNDAGVGAMLGFESVFGDKAIFVEAEEAGDGADEAAIEDAAGELVPLVAFEGFEEAGADACGGGDFLEGDAAHFSFAL